jgi:hypothetical protein
MTDRSSLLVSRMIVVGKSVIYIFKFKLVDKKTENLYIKWKKTNLSYKFSLHFYLFPLQSCICVKCLSALILQFLHAQVSAYPKEYTVLFVVVTVVLLIVAEESLANVE